ncbi:MAG: NAD(P)-dependent oxidoreductase [Bacteroidales bacterium]|nr:NAD(P)-dependent oxidoreductase [Bacteroidales bacterium]
MRTILVTGASGFLGHFVVEELLKYPEFAIIAIGGRPEDKANPLPESPRLRFYALDALFTEEFADIETVINCAFARSNDAQQLAAAIDFTRKAIDRFKELKVKSVINISTQGVYERLPKGEFSNENSPVLPIDLYSMVKYSVEAMFCVSGIPYVTNVRLASLMMPQRFLYFFVKKAKSGEPFTVTAPKQYAAFLDVKDAASGLMAIARLVPEQRASIYNLGIGRQYSLLEYAESVKSIGCSLGYNVAFDVADNGTEVCAGMDCTRLMNDTGWSPSCLKEEMILDLFNTIQL